MDAPAGPALWRSLALKGLLFVGAASVVLAILWQSPAQSTRPQGTLTSPEPLIVQAAPRDLPQLAASPTPAPAPAPAPAPTTASAVPSAASSSDHPSAPPAVQAPASTRAASAPTQARPSADAGARVWREPIAKLHVGSEKLDVNRATALEFERLPGIGAGLAKQLVAYRAEHGAYRTVEELRQVKGIGVKRFERLSPFVTVTAPPGTQASEAPGRPAKERERERQTL